MMPKLSFGCCFDAGRESRQQSCLDLQLACFVEQQDLRSTRETPVAPGSLSTITMSSCGGVTLCSRAHASRWAGVWQQQLSQHCSALRQPQGLSMQGNGTDTSLVEVVGSGSGKPPATTKYMNADSHPASGKLHLRIERFRRRDMSGGKTSGQISTTQQYNCRMSEQQSA